MNKDIQKILSSIKKKARLIKRPLCFMELCGTHSQTIAQYAIKQLLPKNISLVSGPGCPVCVTSQEEVDVLVGMALSGIPIVAYGDAVSVPGSVMSLEGARQNGADVSIVYDVTEALKMAKEKKDLVFWGIGFETTTPATAWAVRNGLKVFSSHKLFPPAMEALLGDEKMTIDGFINPGHVSAIIGTEAYEKLQLPQVVAGFEAIDVLLAIDMLLSQVASGKHGVENEYKRVVKKNGNKKALKAIRDTFDVYDSQWRGLGLIKKSGLKLKEGYLHQDAEFIHQDLIKKIKSDIKPTKSACRCGEVLRGHIRPQGCPLFGKVCQPKNPQGACMVSVEGSCNIEYRFSNS